MTEVIDQASLSPQQAVGIAVGVGFEAFGSPGSTGTKVATAGSNADCGNAHLLALRLAP